MEAARARDPGAPAAFPIPTRDARRERRLTAMPDSDSPAPAPPARRYEPRNLPVPVPQRRRANGDGWFARVAARAVRLEDRARSAPTSRTCSTPMTPGESGFSPEESRMLKNILALRERRVERRHGAARRHHRRAAGHLARRTGAGVRERRPFAPRGLQRHARRSGRHGAHPRPDRLHDRARRGRPGKERQAQEAAAGRPRSQGDRSLDAAVVDQDRARDPVRAAVDARRSTCWRKHAGDAHPSRAGGRRIWRHRRPGLDRGHRRADRRRDRRRARRGRDCPQSCASPTAPSSPTRAPVSRTSPRSSAPTSTSATRPRRSTRSAAIW